MKTSLGDDPNFGCEDRAAIFAGEDRFAISWPWAFQVIGIIRASGIFTLAGARCSEVKKKKKEEEEKRDF